MTQFVQGNILLCQSVICSVVPSYSYKLFCKQYPIMWKLAEDYDESRLNWGLPSAQNMSGKSKFGMRILLQTCDFCYFFVTLSLFLCLSSVYFLFTLSLPLFIYALERSGLHPFHMFIIISHVTYLLSHAYDISHVNRYHMPTFYHMLLYLLRL